MSIVLIAEPPGYGGVVSAELEHVERGLVGKTSQGTSFLNLDPDSKRASRFVFPSDVRIVKLVACIEGIAGDGVQPVRGVIYDSDGNLVATSDEVEIKAGQDMAWVVLPFSSTVAVSAGSYDLGLHAGANGIARVCGDAFDGLIGSAGPDIYADGPGSVWGSRAVLAYDLSIYAVTIPLWVPAEFDLPYVATLPFREAQNEFRKGGSADPRRMRCGWHGTALDPERGSFALADPFGPAADLVGKRLRVKGSRGRVVYVYCHGADDQIHGDISLSRRLYSALGLLATYPIVVTVTTIPANDRGV